MSDTPRTDDLVLHLDAHNSRTVTQALYCYTMMRNLSDALELEIASDQYGEIRAACDDKIAAAMRRVAELKTELAAALERRDEKDKQLASCYDRMDKAEAQRDKLERVLIEVIGNPERAYVVAFMAMKECGK